MNDNIIEIVKRFVATLKEMFMIEDAAELDFGIYRIMAQKKKEIEAFFDVEQNDPERNKLCNEIKKQLEDFQVGDTADIKKKLEERIRLYREDGESDDAIAKKPKIIELRKKLEDVGDSAVIMPRVLTALNDFFKRYYDKGDFISQRRYLHDGGSYVIPYNGEEVKLHWANADQYYIKTSENFRNYRFRLSNGKEVEFTLKNAVQLKNNEKEQKDWARKFKLWDGRTDEGDAPVDYQPVRLEDDGVLHIFFTYELMKKKGNEQKTLNASVFETLSDIIGKQYADYSELLQKRGENKDEELKRHINRYTAKNSSDYFIHKNLGTFLRRELDFYIKNEILHIGDLDISSLRRTLAEAKTIKAIGETIIEMLAGLEDFQKKLWLKKKFVVQSDYCITLDRVPESLYKEICDNDEQRKEWVRLFAIDEIRDDGLGLHDSYSEPLSVKFLQENPNLVLDTRYFTAEFKHSLLSSIENIDEQCDGLLINSENFQALELLQEKYMEKLDGVYLDPPYNTKKNEFIYKDSYKRFIRHFA